jgi:hypothetical protein
MQRKMMYLPQDKWSSRYDKQFYTIQINGYSTLDKPPEGDFVQDTCFLCTHKFPATYYTIEISCGHDRHIVHRRYSQFVTLCKKFDPSNQLGVRSKLPPKTGLFHKDINDFLEDRMNALYGFLKGLLTRQEAVGNGVVERFLELGVFMGGL